MEPRVTVSGSKCAGRPVRTPNWGSLFLARRACQTRRQRMSEFMASRWRNFSRKITGRTCGEMYRLQWSCLAFRERLLLGSWPCRRGSARLLPNRQRAPTNHLSSRGRDGATCGSCVGLPSVSPVILDLGVDRLRSTTTLFSHPSTSGNSTAPRLVSTETCCSTLPPGGRVQAPHWTGSEIADECGDLLPRLPNCLLNQNPWGIGESDVHS